MSSIQHKWCTAQCLPARGVATLSHNTPCMYFGQPLKLWHTAMVKLPSSLLSTMPFSRSRRRVSRVMPRVPMWSPTFSSAGSPLNCLKGRTASAAGLGEDRKPLGPAKAEAHNRPSWFLHQRCCTRGPTLKGLQAVRGLETGR